MGHFLTNFERSSIVAHTTSEGIGTGDASRTSGERVAETSSLVHEFPCEDRRRALVALHDSLHIRFYEVYQ